LSLEKELAKLIDPSKPIKGSKLANLCCLSSKEIKTFVKAWVKMSKGRRRELVHQLVILSRHNIELNFDEVFQVLLLDPDAWVRAKAIEGLWESEDCRLIGLLIELLDKDGEAAVRAAAAIALGRFALLTELRAIPPHYAVRIVKALLKAIEDEEIEVRRRAIEAIAPLNLYQVKEIIEKAYQEEDSRVRSSALYAMGRNCDQHWLPILLKELSNPDSEIRLGAVRGCGEMGEENIAPYLKRLIRDPCPRVQSAAREALKQVR
jgi:HEAT repeat protein